MKLLVGESSGATGEDVDCNSHILSAFDDLRFTTDDGTTLLDYWTESITGSTPNRLATVWIEFGTIGTGATTFYMYYGKASAAAVSSGANTFIVFDDFERGADGDAVGGSWTITGGDADISTEQKWGGTRSMKLIGAAAGAANVTIPRSAGTTYAIRLRWYKEDASRLYVLHGNGTERIYLRHYSDETLASYNGAFTTLSTETADAWHLLEVNDINLGTPKYDVWVDGVRVGDDCDTFASAVNNGTIGLLGAPTDGADTWIDNFIVRQWDATEPAWGSWGSETAMYLKAASAATVATVGTVSRAMTWAKAVATATVATVGTVGRTFTWLKAVATATVATVGTVGRDVTKHVSAAVQAVGASIRPLAITRAISGAVGTIGAVARSTSKHVADASVDTVATVVRGMVWHKYVATAIVSTAGTVARKTGQHVTAIVSTVASVTPRNVKRAIAAAVATVGTVPRAITKRVAATTVATVGTVRRLTSKIVSAATAATVGTVKRKAGKVVTGTATAIGLSIRPITVGKHVTGTVATVGTIRPVNIWRTITATVGTVGVVLQKTSKHVATAVVSTVGTIWATAVQVVSGGVSTVASVSRKTFRHVTAVVSTVATVSDFLYDIVYAMNQTIRHIYGKVRITYTDPYFSAGVATSADAVGDYTYTDQTVDNVTTETYKWFSLHRNILDGTFHPLPGDQSISVGWWGTQLSDFMTHAFVPTYPKLTLTHAARTVSDLLVVGDDKLDEYPVDFTIKLYDASNVLQHTETVVGNAYYLYSTPLSPAHTGIAKQELEITKWSRGDSVVKIAQFFTTLEETYESEDGELVDINVTEQREFTGTTIPQGNLANSEIRVRLNNIDGTFDAGNTASRLNGLLLNNRAITAWLGVDLIPSGVRRWYPLGTFYSRDWSAPDSEIWAEVSGQDMLSRLQTTTFSTSTVYESKTLEELAIIIMTDAGLTSADWDIDAALAAITVPYAWFDAISHRECLRKIAAACMGQCYCNRDGKIVLEVYSAPSLNPFEYTSGNVFDIDHPLAWSQMVNYVEAQAAPRVAGAEVDIVTDVETITIPAGSSVTKTHFYVSSPCIDVQAPVIVADPDVTVSAYTAYAWGISITYANAGGGAETVTSVTVAGKPLDVQGSRVVVAQDASSIAQNGKQTLSETITSEFWQDETRAQAVADGILQTFRNPRRDIVMRARGNIAQLLGDRVKCPDSLTAGTTAHFGIVGQDINYDGGLEIVVTAQRLGVMTSKTVTATVGTVATRSWKPVAKKGLAVGTVATVGTVSRKVTNKKTVTGTVSAIGTLAYVTTYALDVGPGAIVRSGGAIAGYTRVDEGNPANASGTLTSVSLYFNTIATGVKVTTFTKSGTTFTPHAVATIGTVAAGSKQTFAVGLAVAAGDYIGCYFVSGSIEGAGVGGAGLWFCAGDQTGGAATYSPNATGVMSIFANGHL